jgi:hypothetical protein
LAVRKSLVSHGLAQVGDGRRLYQVRHMQPWTNALVERNERLLPHDWWPYGIAANRTALDTYLRYHHEQGLSSRRWAVDEAFVQLDTRRMGDQLRPTSAPTVRARLVGVVRGRGRFGWRNRCWSP